MTKKEAARLKRLIDQAECNVEIRSWGRGYYDLIIIDRATGYTGVVASLDAWAERVQASQLQE